MNENALTEVVTSIAILAAALVVSHHADKALIAGVRKIRPAFKIRKFSKVKPS
jgi:hypothetical protein